jgi:hypothetical protein
MKYVLIALALTATVSAQATAKEITDAQCISIIVQANRNAYYRTGRPCACPYDRDAADRECGDRSAYRRPGGASPYCYDKDVPKAEIDSCKAIHN